MAQTLAAALKAMDWLVVVGTWLGTGFDRQGGDGVLGCDPGPYDLLGLYPAGGSDSGLCCILSLTVWCNLIFNCQ